MNLEQLRVQEGHAGELDHQVKMSPHFPTTKACFLTWQTGKPAGGPLRVSWWITHSVESAGSSDYCKHYLC